jgi:hypothetical protein
MTTQNPEDTPPVIDPPPAPQGLDSRRRLRELLSVPERDRSDEQWDEIIELEIQLAPGNRLSGQEIAGGGGNPNAGHGRAPGPGGQQQKKHRPRNNNNNNNRRPRSNKPPGAPT